MTRLYTILGTQRHSYSLVTITSLTSSLSEDSTGRTSAESTPTRNSSRRAYLPLSGRAHTELRQWRRKRMRWFLRHELSSSSRPELACLLPVPSHVAACSFVVAFFPTLLQLAMLDLCTFLLSYASEQLYPLCRRPLRYAACFAFALESLHKYITTMRTHPSFVAPSTPTLLSLLWPSPVYGLYHCLRIAPLCTQPMARVYGRLMDLHAIYHQLSVARPYII